MSINNDNISSCSHTVSDTFSGDLICTKCGQVLQNNSQLASEPVYLDRDRKYTGSQSHCNNNNKINQISHQERSESALLHLLRKVITSFSLKASYETEAVDLIHRYWQVNECKQKYGMTGNRLLIAVVFLLARRDRLAVNLNLLAGSIGASPQECGVFFDPLIKIDPKLRSLARVNDFIARAVDLITNQLSLSYGIVIRESHLHFILQQAAFIADLLQEEESGSSRSAECTAIAATWISLSSALLSPNSGKTSTSSLDMAIQNVTDSSGLSLKTVKTKYNALVDKLLERAEILLPSTFTIKNSRPRKIALLLLNLNELTQR